MTLLVCAMIALVSLAGILPNTLAPVWYPQLIVLSLFSFLYINYTLWKFNKILSIFLIYCLISVFFYNVTFVVYNLPSRSLKSIFFYTLSSFGNINPRQLVLLCHIYLCSYISYRISFISRKSREWVVRTLVAILVLNLFWSLLQHFNVDPIFNSISTPGKDNIVGFMGSYNCFSSFVTILTPLLYIISPLFSIIAIIFVLLVKTWFSVFVILASTLIFLMKYRKKLLLPLGIFLGVVSILSITKFDTIDFKGNRVAVWRTSIGSILHGRINLEKDRTIKCNPLFGFGLGEFPRYFPNYPEKSLDFNTPVAKYNHAHNDFVEVLFDLGLIGAGLLVLLLLSLLRKFLRTSKTKEFVIYSLCLLSYILCANSYFVSHMPVTGMILVVIYGLWESVRRENGSITSVV